MIPTWACRFCCPFRASPAAGKQEVTLASLVCAVSLAFGPLSLPAELCTHARVEDIPTVKLLLWRSEVRASSSPFERDLNLLASWGRYSRRRASDTDHSAWPDLCRACPAESWHRIWEHCWGCLDGFRSSARLPEAHGVHGQRSALPPPSSPPSACLFWVNAPTIACPP